MDKKLIHRFVDKTKSYNDKSTQGLQSELNSYEAKQIARKASVGFRERELKKTLNYLRHEQRKIQQEGSVLPEWFHKQMEAENRKVQQKKRELQEKFGLRKPRTKKNDSIDPATTEEKKLENAPGETDSVEEDDLSDISSDVPTVIVKKPQPPPGHPLPGPSPPGQPSKPGTKPAESADQQQPPTDKTQSMLNVSQYFANLRNESGKYVPGTAYNATKSIKPKEDDDVMDVKMKAGNRQMRDLFQRDFIQKKTEYVRQEKLKKALLPGWLIDKQTEHESAIMAVQEEMKQKEEERRERMMPKSATDAVADKYGMQKQTTTHKGNDEMRKTMQEEMMKQYLKVLASTEEKMKQFQSSIDLGTTNILHKDERRAKNKMEELKTDMDKASGRYTNPLLVFLTPLQVLNCSYLRLQPEQVRRLENMAKAEGHSDISHVHLKPEEIDVFFENLNKAGLIPEIENTLNELLVEEPTKNERRKSSLRPQEDRRVSQYGRTLHEPPTAVNTRKVSFGSPVDGARKRLSLLPPITERRQGEQKMTGSTKQDYPLTIEKASTQQRRESKQERRASKQERRGSKQERRGSKQERRGSKQERRGSKQERRGSKQERRGSKQERMGSKQDRRGSKQERRQSVSKDRK